MHFRMRYLCLYACGYRCNHVWMGLGVWVPNNLSDKEGALQSESWDNIGNSWRDDPYSSQDTAAKLRDLIYVLKQVLQLS